MGRSESCGGARGVGRERPADVYIPCVGIAGRAPLQGARIGVCRIPGLISIAIGGGVQPGGGSGSPSRSGLIR